MTSLRPFSMFDLLKFNNVNLDLLTETYNNRFYGNYLSEWPEYCVVAESASGKIQGYCLIRGHYFYRQLCPNVIFEIVFFYAITSPSTCIYVVCVTKAPNLASGKLRLAIFTHFPFSYFSHDAKSALSYPPMM